MRRSLAVTALAASIVGLGASPAWASGNDDGEWVPAPADYYAATDTEACGSVVTIEGGDVREAEMRQRVRDDGTTVIDYRGAATLDLTRKSDGAMIDELDISGLGHEVVSPDGSRDTITLDGPSLLTPSPAPADQAAFEKEGLPDLAYYRNGEVTLRLTIDPEKGELTDVQFTDVDAHIIDLCGWFDRAHRNGDDDS